MIEQPGPYCLLDRNCSICRKEMYDRSEPITDGALDVTYICHECATKLYGYIQCSPILTQIPLPPPTPINSLKELISKFGRPRKNNND